METAPVRRREAGRFPHQWAGVVAHVRGTELPVWTPLKIPYETRKFCRDPAGVLAHVAAFACWFRPRSPPDSSRGGRIAERGVAEPANRIRLTPQAIRGGESVGPARIGRLVGGVGGALHVMSLSAVPMPHG